MSASEGGSENEDRKLECGKENMKIVTRNKFDFVSLFAIT